MNEIKFKAPKGATHYFKNDYVVAYFFYSNDVNMWFVWVSHWDYWSSKVFIERIEELQPL